MRRGRAIRFAHSGLAIRESSRGRVHSTSPATVFTTTFPDGLVAWYRADDIAGNDGDAIAAWPDRSGSARGLAQAVAGNKPLLKKAANGLGGRNVLRFDGVDDFVSFVNATPIIAGTGLTAYAVHRLITPQSVGRIVSIQKTADPGDASTLTSAVALYDNFGQIATFRAGIQGPFFVTTLPAISTAIFDGTTSPGQITLRQNGPATKQTVGNSSWSAAAFSAEGIYLGRNVSGVGPYSGDIAEVLVYNQTHTPAQALVVEQMLGAYYGLTIT